ncbi:hypothetical protein LPJ66_005038, partial [Kickxella alabastrina]
NSPPVAPAAATNSAAGAPKLAPGWRTAYTGDGIAYYYHETTKQTQWEPPVAETAGHSVPVPPATSNTGAGAACGNSRRSNLGLPCSADHHTSGSGAQYHYNQAHESRVPSASSVSMPGDRWGASAGAEDAKMSGVPKTRADEAIDRAQRMGAMQSRASTISGIAINIGGGGTSAKAGGAVPAALQLVTPETDGDRIVSSSLLAHKHSTNLETNPKTVSSSSGTSNVPSSSAARRGSPTSAQSAISAKRDKLEKKATAELAAFVVRAMAKYKGQLGHDDFKHEARKITKILMEKERKLSPFDPMKLIDMSQHKKTKVRQFVWDYMAKLVGRRMDGDSPRETPISSASVPRTPPIPPTASSGLR